MSKVTPFPYYNDLHDRRYAGLELTDEDFKLRSKFSVKLIKPLDQPVPGVPPEYDIPLHRFNFLNKKLREFPIKEKEGNIQIVDFGDGFGETYAYKWKNTDSVVGYYMQFDDDTNIDIKGSAVNSGTSLFAKNGSIQIKGSSLENCTIYAEGNISIIGCILKNCYIFGQMDLNGVNSLVRCRFIGTNMQLNGLTLKAPTLFYNPTELNQGKMKVIGSIFKEKCEIIGGVDIKGTTFIGPTRIQGKCEVEGVTFLGETQIISKNVNIKSTIFQKNNFAVIADSCTIKSCTIKGTPFIGGNANLKDSIISGSPIIIENSTVKSSTISGGIITQTATIDSGILTDHVFITGSATVKGGTVNNSGIVAGTGTLVTGKVLGLVNNGVICSHTVAEGQCHWDKRSCEETQKNQLIDERKENTSPGKSDADQSSEPSIV